DRGIVTIKYNVLNLPDIVQFKNGNQIRNTYDAGGRKLGAEYFTQLTAIAPLTDGQIVNPWLCGFAIHAGKLFFH
ncbi:MAG TPA: hypothetical protein VK152_07045, partial [Paludibacter sp.]|nr:hypothetical protein [Paludibacter sp.]